MRNQSTGWQSWRTRPPRPDAIEPPLRAELFSVEQLARHARALAEGHRIVIRRQANRLLARLDANERNLRAFNRATHAWIPAAASLPPPNGCSTIST